MTIFDIINKIAETSSLNEKQAILEANKDNEVLKLTFLYAENPRFNFWIKGVDEITAIASVEQSAKEIDLTLDDFTKLRRFINREVTGNDARQYFMECLKTLDPQSARIFNRIVNRDLRCKCGTSIANKVWPGLIEEFPQMLCGKLKAKTEAKIRKWKSIIAQTKMDAGRVFVDIDDKGVPSFRSRNGSHLALHGVFDDMFSGIKSVVLDGEILSTKPDGSYETRKESNGLYTKAVRGTMSKTEAETMKIVLWDMVPADVYFGKTKSTEAYKTRFANLIAAVIKSKKVDIVKSKEVKTFEQAMEFYQEQREIGEEGAIFKNPDAPWKDTRSDDSIKVKAEDTGDFLVTGWYFGQPGTQFAEKVGGLTCQSACGKIKFNVGSGFGDKNGDRDDGEKYVGKIVEIMYNEIISSRDRKDGTLSLFLPIFKQVRWDKTTANTLEELK